MTTPGRVGEKFTALLHQCRSRGLSQALWQRVLGPAAESPRLKLGLGFGATYAAAGLPFQACAPAGSYSVSPAGQPEPGPPARRDLRPSTLLWEREFELARGDGLRLPALRRAATVNLRAP